VDGLDDDAAAIGLERVHEGVGDFAGEAFLDLGTTGVAFNEASELAETGNAPLGNVGDVGVTREGEQVMLAGGGEGDVTKDNHLLVAFVKGDTEVAPGVFTESGKELGVGRGDAGGSTLQAFAVGVFADGEEDLADGGLDPREVDDQVRGAIRVRRQRAGSEIGNARMEEVVGGHDSACSRVR